MSDVPDSQIDPNSPTKADQDPAAPQQAASAPTFTDNVANAFTQAAAQGAAEQTAEAQVSGQGAGTQQIAADPNSVATEEEEESFTDDDLIQPIGDIDDLPDEFTELIPSEPLTPDEQTQGDTSIQIDDSNLVQPVGDIADIGDATDLGAAFPELTPEEIQGVADFQQETFYKANTHSANSEKGDEKRRRKLKDRKTRDDHYEVESTEEEGGNHRVKVRATGSVARGQTVGGENTYEFTVNQKQFDRSINSLRNYAINYERMNDFQRGVGAIDTFYEFLSPYIDRPSSQQIGQVVNGLNITSQWDSMSDYNRFRNTATGLMNTARSLGYKVPKEFPTALGALNFGFSAYKLLNDWDNMSAAERTIATLHTINQGAQAFQAGSALINAYSGVTGTALAAKAGTQVVGQAGTQAAAQGGATVAGTAAAALNVVAGMYAAYQIVDGWGQGGDANSRQAGATNGASVGYTIGGPWGAVIGAVVGLGIGSINAGKSGPQRKRDALRQHYQKFDLISKDEEGRTTVGLADGTRYDVGVDGTHSTAKYNGEDKTYANPDLIADRDKGNIMGDNKLRPYDIDYTNDLDYITSIATKAAGLLPVGGSRARKTSEVDQMNGYLTNAATSNAGREFTEENFTKVMSNVRGFYKDMGIESAAQGMQIANKLREDGRLSKDDYNAMVLGFQFAFSNNFARAEQLLGELGRRGDAPPDLSADEFQDIQDEDLGPIFDQVDEEQEAARQERRDEAAAAREERGEQPQQDVSASSTGRG